MIGNSAGINGVVDNTTARVFAEGTRMTETAQEATQRRFTGGEVDSPRATWPATSSGLASSMCPTWT